MLNNTEILTNLYRRIYSKTDKGEKIVFENDEQKYKTHALLQSFLYRVERECNISYENKNCIDDGGVTISSGEFKSMTTTYKNRYPTNPKKEPWKPETFYFYNCAVADEFNAGNTRYEKITEVVVGHNIERTHEMVNFVDFKSDKFIQYKAQYQSVQKALRTGHLSTLNLPQDVMLAAAIALNNTENLVQILKAQSAEQVDQTLKNLAKNNDELGLKIQALIDSEEYKTQYEAAKRGEVNDFKKFCFACLYFIIHSLKFISLQESFAEAQENYSKDYIAAINSSSREEFTEYIKNQATSDAAKGL